MDKEINFINEILVNSDVGLSTSDISKIIYQKYNAKVSRTIVKNYLWSYFRSIIKYDSSNYTYTLINDKFLLNDIEVLPVLVSSRPINTNIKGSKIKVEYNEKIPIEIYIKALAIINFKVSLKKSNIDLLKQLNRVVEQIINDND